MSGTAVISIGLVLAGGVTGAFLAWVLSARRRTAERDQLERQWGERAAEDTVSLAHLTRQIEATTRLLAEREATLHARELHAKEQQRIVHGLQAKVIDRESTISSFRSRLYGARRSIAILEEELAVQTRSNVELSLAGEETESLSLYLR